MEAIRLDSAQTARDMRRAMRLSLLFGIGMFFGKTAAYLFTGSAAILSDAVESVIHVVAVGFAAYSLSLSSKPANQRFHYGYERITFFSAGFEGAMIILAALAIIAAAIQKWLAGIPLTHVSAGTLFTLLFAVINAGLGWYLVRTGRRTHSLILEANGKHVLTDSWTSFGVVAGLGLVLWTGWKPFDPLVAIAVAVNILWSGSRLIGRSVRGLMDYADPVLSRELREKLDALCREYGVEYHGLRFRTTGSRVRIEAHLLFPQEMPVGEAHRVATQVEERLSGMLGVPAEVITHLESLEDHQRVHREAHYTGKPS